MLLKCRPEIGLWYQEMDAGYQFEVVAIDDETGVVETQLAEGDIVEFEQKAWFRLNLQSIDAPEYWSEDCDYDSLLNDTFDEPPFNTDNDSWLGSVSSNLDEGYDADREW